MSDSVRSDTDLVFAIANGERAALGELYDRYAPLLLAIGMRTLKERSEAEEVLHEVFMEAWRAADRFDPDRGTVRAWLATRMRSRALDRCRSAAWARRETLDHPLAAPLEDPIAGADHGRVRSALDQLPLEQRLVLELGYFEGLSCTEIAARIAVPVGTVKSRTAAALSKLRDELLGARR